MAGPAGPAVFGAFAAASILVAFTGLFAEFGMQAALIQRRDNLEEAAATTVIGTLAGDATLAGLLFVNAVPLAPAAIMQRRFLPLRMMILEPISLGTYAVVTTVALATGTEIWGFVVGFYAGAVVRALAAWLLGRWWPEFRKASFQWGAIWCDMVATSSPANSCGRSPGIANTALLGRFVGAAPRALLSRPAGRRLDG